METSKNNLWEEKEGALYRYFEFKDFTEAFSFMKKVAKVAEQQNHHPTWKNTYNKLEIWLSTHDAGDVISEKDQKMASAINDIKINLK